MEARLSEVQKRLLQIVLVSLALALVVRPDAGNHRYAAALSEVETFRAGFVQREAEAALQQQAAAQGSLSLPTLVSALQEKRGPRLKLAEGLEAPKVVASLHVGTLADAQRLGQGEASSTVGVPDVDALASSLAWRLARTQHAGVLTLTKIALSGAAVSDDEAERDPGVGALRSQSLAARAAADEAARRVSGAERRLEKREKRHSRSIDKARAQLESARAALAEKSQAHTEAQARYDQAAQRAEQPHPLRPFSARPTTALARIELTQGGERLAYDVPVRLIPRSVSVPGLRGSTFQAVQAAGLWDEVKGLSPSAASAAIEGHFNWHARTLRLAGLALHGSKLLALLPCLLPVLLGLLLLQIRRAETFYSPFSTKVPSSLPRVGLQHRSLEFGALVLLPIAVPGCACVALLAVQELPLLPALSALATGGLGTHAFIKLEDLRRQAISIVRSHSYPPPAADLSTINWG